MPKFGQVQFNEDYFGDGRLSKTFRKKSIGGQVLGMEVRRSIAKRVTFRVRTGNGHYGSIAGHRYQDKYGYFVPSSINNAESNTYRTLFTNAVAYWQNTLTDAEKKAFNARATHGLRMSGYNLFIREVVLGKIVL